MEVSYELLRDGWVFVYRLSGELDMAAMKEWTSKWEAEILRPATHPIFYITDFSGITKVPMNTLSSARNMARKPDPNLKLNVVVVRSMFLVTLANLIARVTTTFRLQVVPTMEAAWEVIDHALEQEQKARSANESKSEPG